MKQLSNNKFAFRASELSQFSEFSQFRDVPGPCNDPGNVPDPATGPRNGPGNVPDPATGPRNGPGNVPDPITGPMTLRQDHVAVLATSRILLQGHVTALATSSILLQDHVAALACTVRNTSVTMDIKILAPATPNATFVRWRPRNGQEYCRWDHVTVTGNATQGRIHIPIRKIVRIHISIDSTYQSG